MSISSRSSLLLLLTTLALLAGLPRPTPADPVQELLRRMAARLQVQHEVARWKWNAGRPIEDRAREQALLDAMQRRAARYGLAPGFVRSFFASQIEAGKRLQHADFEHWRRQGVQHFPGVVDLSVLRQRLDVLGEELLASLAAAHPWLADPANREALPRLAERHLAGPGIDEPARREALTPLLGPP